MFGLVHMAGVHNTYVFSSSWLAWPAGRQDRTDMNQFRRPVARVLPSRVRLSGRRWRRPCSTDGRCLLLSRLPSHVRVDSHRNDTKFNICHEWRRTFRQLAYRCLSGYYRNYYSGPSKPLYGLWPTLWVNVRESGRRVG